MKKCGKCGIEKDEIEFNKDSTKKDGLHSTCKCCRKEWRTKNADRIARQKRQWALNNKTHVSEYNKLYAEKNKDWLKEYYREYNIVYQPEYYSINKQRIAERNKKYRDEHKKSIAEYHKKYRRDNKDYIREDSKEYYAININKIGDRHQKYYEANKGRILEREKERRIKNKGLRNKYLREYRRMNKMCAEHEGVDMVLTTIDDQDIIKKALEMKSSGRLVSDIASELSKQTGKRITKASLWRLFKNPEHSIKTSYELSELDYPSRKEIENIFSELLQKEDNFICVHGNVKLKRNLMIRILNAYINKEFTYNEVRINLNQWVNENVFYQHWDYLLKFNYIERVDEYKFKFCDRVKKWKNFGQI